MNDASNRPTGWTRRSTHRVLAARRTVFNLIAEVELWPALFSHVRSARVLRREGRRRLVAVSARWHGLPVCYRAIQSIEDEAYVMTIRHVSRLTRGSLETWSVLPAPDAATEDRCVDLLLEQAVVVPVPLIGDILASRFIGGQVACELGVTMARRVQEIAEGGSLAGRD